MPSIWEMVIKHCSITAPNSSLDTTTQHCENKKQPKHACSEADRTKHQIQKYLIKTMLPNLKNRTSLEFCFGIFSPTTVS